MEISALSFADKDLRKIGKIYLEIKFSYTLNIISKIENTIIAVKGD